MQTRLLSTSLKIRQVLENRVWSYIPAIKQYFRTQCNSFYKHQVTQGFRNNHWDWWFFQKNSVTWTLSHDRGENLKYERWRQWRRWCLYDKSWSRIKGQSRSGFRGYWLIGSRRSNNKGHCLLFLPTREQAWFEIKNCMESREVALKFNSGLLEEIELDFLTNKIVSFLNKFDTD